MQCLGMRCILQSVSTCCFPSKNFDLPDEFFDGLARMKGAAQAKDNMLWLGLGEQGAGAEHPETGRVHNFLVSDSSHCAQKQADKQ